MPEDSSHDSDAVDAQIGRRSLRRRVFVLLASALLLAALLVGDWLLRNRELDQLLDRAEASEAVLVRFDSEAQNRFEQYVDHHGDASRWPTSTSDAFDAELTELARDVGADAAVALDRVRDVWTLPWHRSLADARSDYAAHVESWLDYFHAVARDTQAISDDSWGIDIGGSFTIAERSFRDAIPFCALGKAADRIDRIFDDDEEEP